MTDRPDPGDADTGQADLGRPDTGQPATGRSGTNRSGIDHPDAGQADLGRPDTGQPVTGRSGTNRSGTGQRRWERGRPIAVVGPTATGKSALAIEIAHDLGDGEVINADAMQLYRGMDIGTAKLTPDERGGVPHHLLDVLDVTDTASVAAYQRDARAAVDGILGRGGTPILVGGSGLYVAAVVDELRFPGTDAAVRAELEAELAVVGPAELHRRLAVADPPAAAAILPSNGRRIVRALEVVAITGEPFSAFLPTHGPAWRDTVLVGLDRPTDELDERIGLRVEHMFATGLVDEVRGLLDRGLADGRTASTAVGYRQVADALAGHCTLAQAAVDTAAATRRLVRRQRSWFRRDPRIEWR